MRHRTRAKAFTLVELTAVLLLITVLLVTLTVGYRQWVQKTQDRAAKGRISAVLTVQLTHAGRTGAYAADPAALDGLDNDTQVTDQASSGPAEISIAVSQAGSLGLAALSRPGQCQLLTVPALLESSQRSWSTTAGACTGAAALPADEQPATPAP